LFESIEFAAGDGGFFLLGAEVGGKQIAAVSAQAFWVKWTR
jgi:hypothetical protein